jgi:hypothetical protein
MTSLVLVLVEDSEILLLLAVEVQAGDWLAVVVVEQNGKIRLRVSVHDALGFDLAASDCLDDLVALELLEGRLDFGVAVKICFDGALAADRFGGGDDSC